MSVGGDNVEQSDALATFPFFRLQPDGKQGVFYHLDRLAGLKSHKEKVMKSVRWKDYSNRVSESCKFDLL